MIHPIHIYGSPVLHRPSAPVTDFSGLDALARDMWETTKAAPGVGLAAPQIGLDMAMFVWVYPHQSDGPAQGVAINPELYIDPIQPGLPTAVDREGCLSFPGYKFPLLRSERVLLRAQDQYGTPYELEATDWFARILQHEYDHLQGTIYVDRLPGQEEIRSIIATKGWGKPGLTWLGTMMNETKGNS